MTTPFDRDKLSPDTLRRLVEILTHFGRINTVSERQTFLELSGLQSLTPHLHLNETTHQFATELIRESQRVGSFTAGGEPAFYQLLGCLQAQLTGHPEEHEFVAGLRRTTTPPVTRADTLQRPSLDFTGRTAEIERLTNALRQGRPVMISGMGGIGKSDLARKVAQGIREEPQSEFLGPALQVELQPDNKPVTATELVGTLILALAPTTKLPDTLTERVVILHPLMQGQKGTLLLDNAAAHEQIQPLESLWHGWAVIITSRTNFVIFGNHVERLSSLGISDAENLVSKLTTTYGRALTSEEVSQVARVCQFHPLALMVASAYLATKVNQKVNKYIDMVRKSPITALIADPNYANVGKVLGVSVQQLHKDNRILSKRWHLLAQMPDIFNTELAAGLWGKIVHGDSPDVKPLDMSTTNVTLDTLVQLNLLEFIDSEQVQEEPYYRMHDFLTDYALHHSPYRPSEKVQDNAILCHALTALKHGNILNDLYLYGKPSEALAKFDLLWNHLDIAWKRLNLVKHSVSTFFLDMFPAYMINLLYLRLTPRRLILYNNVALDASHIRNTRSNEALHLGNLGILNTELGEMLTAISYYEQALTISRELGDKYSEAIRLSNLGNAYAALGQIHTAINYYEQALVIEHILDNKRSEGITLGNLGGAYHELKEVLTAINYYEQALIIARKTSDKLAEGNHVGNLGLAYADLMDFDRAIDYLKQSITIRRENGDRVGEGISYWNLALVYQKKGEQIQAITYAHTALTLFEVMEDPRGKIVHVQLREWGVEDV